jgi:hypothetical protein
VSSKGDTLTTAYFYPCDYSGNPYNEMLTKNMLPVVESFTKKGDTEIERTKTEYIKSSSRTNNLILPDKTKKSYTGQANLQTEISFDLYDNKGNIRQYTTADGVATSILWYNNFFPTAEIKNAAYEQVKNMFLQNLRTLLPHALVTTYTYQPLVGMTSKTDPRGVTTYYEYDDFGRLKRVKLGTAVLEEYDYHYKNQ